MDHRNIVAQAMDEKLASEERREAVVRALSLWETWIIIASMAYLLGHFDAFARRGFRVSNGEDAFAFYAQEASR